MLYDDAGQNPRFQPEHQSAASGRDEPIARASPPLHFSGHVAPPGGSCGRLPGNPTMDLGDWPRSLGLGRYGTAFRENEIDEAVPPNLTTEDLDDLGVVIAGTDENCCRRWRGSLLRPSSPPSGSRRCPRRNRDRPSSIRPNAAERRQLTVRFCDMVGFTCISAPMDGGTDAISSAAISTRPQRRARSAATAS